MDGTISKSGDRGKNVAAKRKFDRIAVAAEWSLRSIFGSNIQQTCPSSSLTNVYVDLQASKVNFPAAKETSIRCSSKVRSLNISPEPDAKIEQGETPIVVYELNNEKRRGNAFSLSCSSKNVDEERKDVSPPPPPLVVHRSPTGSTPRETKGETFVDDRLFFQVTQ